jgi:hypothetical protein
MSPDVRCQATSVVSSAANSDSSCQVTRGREAGWADTPYATWVRRRLKQLGWNKQDLYERLHEQSNGRLQIKSAERLMQRVTKEGGTPSRENRMLFEAVLGPDPVDLAERLEALVAQGERVVEELPALLDGARELRDAE